MRTPLLVAVAALTLAGCMAPDEVESASAPGAAGLVADAADALPPLDKEASVDAPTWRVGDAWLIQSAGIQDGEASTLVVRRADGDYEMATTSETAATYDAMFDVSYLGRIRGDDLAGFQQGQPIQFFDFPLSDGKTWSTTWDGITVTLTSNFAGNITTPIGKHPGFVIQGLDEAGQTYVTYDYVPALRWWSHIDFQGYGFQVTGVKSNWTGDVVTGVAKPLLTLASGGAPAATFKVDAEQTTVAMTAIVDTGQAAAYALAVLDPEHQMQEGSPAVSAATARQQTFSVVQFPAKAGEWTVVAPAAHDPAGGIVYQFHQVALLKQQV